MQKKERKRAVPIMLLGTSSHVGKSVLTAGLCRLFRSMGLSVAPFKAQNMALNSYVTLEGAEIGRAQAFQAEAAGIEPTADMNPVLLKPTGDSTSQVIIEGRVHSTMSAREFHAFKPVARETVVKCYNRLANKYDIIVIEGAGSPAEVNLREGDIANMGMAEIADSPALLIGDIDRGGVFASLVGTLMLLTKKERARIKGFIINKFRGDAALLAPGLDDLAKRTGTKTLGVLPYIRHIRLPDEDSVALDEKTGEKENDDATKRINIKIIKLPRISNFTDFDPFKTSPDVSVEFIDKAAGIDNADMVVLPGSKNTLADMGWMKRRKIDKKIIRFSNGGGKVVGICGGLQMLGHYILDPDCIESAGRSIAGLGLLDIITTITAVKATYRVEALAPNPFAQDGKEHAITGYEVHMGESVPSLSPRGATGSKAVAGAAGAAGRPFARITARNTEPASLLDGARSTSGSVWGSYIHGLFDSDTFRASVIESIKEAKGLAPASAPATPFAQLRDKAFDDIAQVLRQNLDIEAIFSIMGLQVEKKDEAKEPLARRVRN